MNSYINDFTPLEALEEYRRIKLDIEPTLDLLKELETKIKSHVLENDNAIEIDGAKTTIRKGYIRSTWNDKGLRGYAVANPEVLSFVKEINVKPSVSIRITEK